jgi:hypothetical protein
LDIVLPAEEPTKVTTLDKALLFLDAVKKTLQKKNEPYGDKALLFLDDVKKTLQEKNKAYGDSASNPLRIFSRSEADEGIKIRIDDKLSRIARGDGSGNEDAVKDLVGYLALLAGMRK